MQYSNKHSFLFVFGDSSTSICFLTNKPLNRIICLDSNLLFSSIVDRSTKMQRRLTLCKGFSFRFDERKKLSVGRPLKRPIDLSETQKSVRCCQQENLSVDNGSSVISIYFS